MSMKDNAIDMRTNHLRAKPTNVTLNPAILAEAKLLGINISQACEKGLAAKITSEKARLWLEENQEGMAESNAYVEKHGLPFAEYRQF